MKINKLTFFLLFFIIFAKSQSISHVSAKNIDGKTISLSTLDDDKPLVISFWATWCLPCLEELNTINEKIDEEKKARDFNFVAVSIDDPRTVNKVKTLVNAKNWNFDEILLDSSQSIKRQLNVNNVPYTLVYYKDKVIYSHVGYTPGDEEELFEKLKTVQ